MCDNPLYQNSGEVYYLEFIFAVVVVVVVVAVVIYLFIYLLIEKRLLV